MTSARVTSPAHSATPWGNPEDDEEIFLFDEDLGDASSGRNSSSSGSGNGKIPLPPTIVKDLIGYGTEDLERSFGEISISIPKTENSFLRPYRYLYSQSPGDMASSADSELSVSMTIEGLRDHLQSCFTCGVIWRENQASLDCNECDGYALTRPCGDCNGSCGAVWSRDLTSSHQTHKAKWIGSCGKLHLRNCSIGTDSCDSNQLSDN